MVIRNASQPSLGAALPPFLHKIKIPTYTYSVRADGEKECTAHVLGTLSRTAGNLGTCKEAASPGPSHIGPYPLCWTYPCL